MHNAFRTVLMTLSLTGQVTFNNDWFQYPTSSYISLIYLFTSQTSNSQCMYYIVLSHCCKPTLWRMTKLGVSELQNPRTDWRNLALVIMAMPPLMPKYRTQGGSEGEGMEQEGPRPPLAPSQKSGSHCPQINFLLSITGHLGWKFSDHIPVFCKKNARLNVTKKFSL